MNAQKPKKSPAEGNHPPQATQQGEAAVQPPQPITHKNSRPRLSGEGADAALLHLIEREKLRTDEPKLP
ncbi:hypothetical protein [Caenimonas soli]|uniref:hypothetical protein n=1 Tax=Caenimonas soli TaxID=2735555 RepID=UPI00155326B1|nr:hypothetical protein [Caenimonas soli]NPC58262.1 hypothetical protein [Caenimonas soli]